jgi:hypothetical protein
MAISSPDAGLSPMTRNRPRQPRGSHTEELFHVQIHVHRIACHLAGAVCIQFLEAVMHNQLHGAEPALTLFPVVSIDDIECLVKESEVVTGLASRTFVVAGADRLFYQLSQHRKGFQLQRLDVSGRVLHSEHLLTFELLEHSLHEALQAGQLYVAPV